LVPIESGGFMGVREGHPWNTISNIEFQDACLKVEDKLFCKIEKEN
ncbi:MAG: hypothetical protein HKN31_14535, partial [Pricia sp.]|nr:hypothetical protein [Pricia sp.]